MCRLFGFRSVIQSQVHSSLLSAENALARQSSDHPDGWGVSYYINGIPHLIKSDQSAMNDQIFQRVSGVVSSETVLAHIRKATKGSNNILNTHPFQYGNWVFAHNGNIKDFDKFKDELLARITPSFKRFILGSTDSELIFFFILSHLSGKIELLEKNSSSQYLISSVQESLEELTKIVGTFSPTDKGPGIDETYLTFILTNGSMMLAHQGGQDLFYSTHKTKCSDRDTCPSYSEECENITKSGYINHLIFTSEPLQGENIWYPMRPGQIIAVDSDMKLKLTS